MRSCFLPPVHWPGDPCKTVATPRSRGDPFLIGCCLRLIHTSQNKASAAGNLTCTWPHWKGPKFCTLLKAAFQSHLLAGKSSNEKPSVRLTRILVAPSKQQQAYLATSPLQPNLAYIGLATIDDNKSISSKCPTIPVANLSHSPRWEYNCQTPTELTAPRSLKSRPSP